MQELEGGRPIFECDKCRKSRNYQQSSWSVFDQAKTLSFSAVIKLFSAVL
jgi:hypothetical protein